jgi:uncharacterized protein (TIGR02099 family)
VSFLSSTLLKTWSGLTRWLLGAVVLAWLLFGVAWGAIHWLIVPRIGDFRPQLEMRASKALGVPVRVGAVTAQSNGMVPSFELTDVALFDAEGRVALSLPRVLVAMSPRSLWRMGFEQLYIDQPKLDVRRAADGRISIAGLNFGQAGGAQPAALDWFFSQTEFAIHNGTLRWTDEQRNAEPLVLQNVDAVVRNLGRHHDLRLDATPPEAWGARFSLLGRFMQPLLARNKGRWQDWEGQLYTSFDRIDLSELRRYADLGFDLSQGKGALRAWVDVSRGQVTGALADVALSEVAVKLGPELQPLSLLQVRGRLGGRLLTGGFELSTQALAFDTPDGLQWPGGNVRLLSMAAQGKVASRGELQADRLDLAALAQIANRLPLDSALREQLVRYDPKGLVDSLAATWQGPAGAPVKYAVKGRLSQLALATVGEAPGVRGLAADFELDQSAGRAALTLANGSVEVPGIFEESVIPVDQLSAELKWQVVGERIAVQLTNARFSNADAQGEAQIKWQTSDPAKSASRSRFPGVLDLQATLSRAEGRRVYRYLPLVIDAQARDYVQAAVLDGVASNVRFLVKGDIDQIPATDPRQGSFRISADVKNARLAYVPRSLQEPHEMPWPELVDINGELVIDRLQLQVKGARARLGDAAGLQVVRVDAAIANLMHTEVNVNADIKGPMTDALRLVNGSPLAAMTAQALANSSATGNADYKLKLVLPVADLGKSTVQGSVVMAGNDVQIMPDTPRLARARGTVNYSHTGFSLAGVQVRMLGGDARLDGGLALAPGADNGRAAPMVIRASGTATAEGLRQASELGVVSRLARQASGSAAYTASLGLRRGVPELLVTSNLQGLAVSLPAPLQKDAQSQLPLRYQTALLEDTSPRGSRAAAPLNDRMSLTLGRVVSVVYERDLSGVEPRVLRGSLGVGAETLDTVVLPDQGVNANISLPQFDVDAWAAVLAQASAAPIAGAVVAEGLVLGYLPSTVAARTAQLTFGERQYSHVVIGAGRDGLLWRANVDATELNGYLEYRQASDASTASGAGRVYARLARLTVAPSAASEVEALLDAQPASIPALDIVVDDFELRGKRFGRLEVEAINRAVLAQPGAPGAREWRLNKFNLIVPEATLTASGNWARINAQAGQPVAASSIAAAERRRTVLNFKLDIADGGKLLGRFGMPDVVRLASGRMEGQIAWMGSPLKLDYPTLGGAFTVNVASGQFLKAEPGIAKLLGVLSLQALPRRLSLDFRDVFSEGFSFDFLRGDVTVDKGLARTNNLQMKGVNAAVLMEGQADIARETQDLKVVVVPEINAGTASLIATVINPAIGLGSFLAQLFLRRPLIESATQEFRVDGSWADPRVTKVTHVAPTTKESSP